MTSLLEAKMGDISSRVENLESRVDDLATDMGPPVEDVVLDAVQKAEETGQLEFCRAHGEHEHDID